MSEDHLWLDGHKLRSELSFLFCGGAGAGLERSGGGVSCLNVIILWHGGHFLSGPVHDSLYYRGFSLLLLTKVSEDFTLAPSPG